jgi:hypothetical protein
MACAAHAVPAVEIHSSWPKGSRSRNTVGIRSRGCARTRSHRDTACRAGSSSPGDTPGPRGPRRRTASATSDSPVEKASQARYGLPDQPPSLRWRENRSRAEAVTSLFGAPAHCEPRQAPRGIVVARGSGAQQPGPGTRDSRLELAGAPESPTHGAPGWRAPYARCCSP